MTKKSEPATKEDVREIVSEIVGEVASEVLNAMADQFGKVDTRLDNLEVKVNRIENILRPTVDKVDDHEVRLKRLEAQPA